MLEEKIKQYFERYPELHVLFLFDADSRSWLDFESIALTGYRKIVYDKNDFYLKYHLNGPWLNDKVVLYLPIAQPITKGAKHAFPLLDLLLANKSIEPDDNISEFMEQYRLQRHQRSLAEKYLPDLRRRAMQEVVGPYLDAAHFTEENIINGLFSASVKFTQPESWEFVLLRLFATAQPGNESEWNRITKKINDYRLEDFLLNKINVLTGIQLTNWSAQDAVGLLDKIKYNLYLSPIREPAANDPYKKLHSHSSDTLNRIHIFHQRLLNHARYATEWQDLLEGNHSAVHESKLVEVYGYNAPYGFYTSRLLWQIIEQLFQLPESEVSIILVTTEELLPVASNKKIQEVLEFLLNSYRAILTIDSIASYTLDHAYEYIHHYTVYWYKIDQYYRKSIWLYRFQIDETEISVTLNWEGQLAVLNNYYRQFLEQSNRAWLRSWSKQNFTTDNLLIVPQYKFYQTEVAPLEQKVAVIISDGLRYEAGLELLEMLNADAKSVAKTRNMLASVPSKTSIGMANLLPGKNFLFNEDNITIDGVSIAGYDKRELLLRQAEGESQVVKLSEVLSNRSSENREIFKKKVVYIYHDVIDARGDKRISERQTFAAVHDAVQELTKLVKQLHSTYNVAKVIITADHGFLYNDFTIEDKDKEKGMGTDVVLSHSRFEILSMPQKPELGYVFPLQNTTRFTDDLFVAIPESVNRYSKAGTGNQYVHGGASLQELIVPVIESTRKREDVSSQVNFTLITREPKVVSNMTKLKLIQDEPVSATEKERTIVMGLYNSGELVSAEKEIALNKTSTAAGDRVFEIDLHLLKHSNTITRYQLKVYDKADTKRLNALLETEVKNQTIIQTDF